jgi:hypothetical protein
MKLMHGDIVVTGKSGLVVIKSLASTYKVSRKSELKLDLKTKEIINSKINYGSVVVEFLKHKLKKSKGKRLMVKSKTAVFGVRGTKFFSYVDPENENSILSVEHGAVSFKGKKSEDETLVKMNSSSMTNKKMKSIKQRKFGFEDKINWNVEDTGRSLKHKKGLFIALSETWNKYKNENAKTWKKNTDEMENLWNNVNN